MASNKKRNDPSTPTKPPPPVNEATSPEKKRLFTGSTDMDEEGMNNLTNSEAAAREERLRAREARKIRIEEQKRTGKKVKEKSPIDSGGNEDMDLDDLKPAAKPAAARGRGRPACGKTRRSSVPASTRAKLKGATRKRSSSVDSSFTTVSGKKQQSDSSSSGSSDKRKRSSTTSAAKTGTKTPKSAKFSDGIPNNEGKTASTKKAVRAKKAGSSSSYAEKAKSPKKSNWAHSTVLEYKIKVGACKSTCTEVYSRLSEILRVIQLFEPDCAIGDLRNAKAASLRSPAEFKFSMHGAFQRHFSVDNETDWQWDDNITEKNPRNFAGSFILLSDKTAKEILEYCRVDLRRHVGGHVGIKSIQELYTSLGYVVLGVHANSYSPSVAFDLRRHLMKAEESLLDRKHLFEKDGLGFFELAFDNVDADWRNLDFPEIVGVRSYPKGGPYDPSKRGVDTSWKLAHHFEFAKQCENRVDVAVHEFIKSGGASRLFGAQAKLTPVITDSEDASGKEAFSNLLPSHQNTNRSVGNFMLDGATNLDFEVAMYFEEFKEDKFRHPKTMTIRDVIRKMYVKIGGRKYPVFLYAFKNKHGKYQLWFWDTVPEIREFVDSFRKHPVAHLWHRCKLWGWETGATRRLFRGSFHSEPAVEAFNSKWNSRKQCVILAGTGQQAGNFLDFGCSPFILRTGEEKSSRLQPAPVQRSDLSPNAGGVEVDDLQSVSGQSFAETIVVEDDDDASVTSEVSEMDENAGFEDEEGYEEYSGDEEEGTVANEEASDEDMEDADEGAEEDSAFSTKAGESRSAARHREELHGLARSGNKIRIDDDDSKDAKVKALELECEALTESLQHKLAMKMAELERKFEADLAAALRACGHESNGDSGPGAGGGATTGGESPQSGETAGASAGNE